MRPVKKKPTTRGLGALGPDAETPAPPRAQGEASEEAPVSVSFRPPLGRPSKSPTQYSSLRPAPRETLAMRSPLIEDKPPSSRRGTTRMPTCVQEIGDATAAVAAGRARTAIVKKLAFPEGLTERVSAREMRLLAVVDGSLSLRSLIDVSGMKESEVLTIVDRLARLQILTLE